MKIILMKYTFQNEQLTNLSMFRLKLVYSRDFSGL